MRRPIALSVCSGSGLFGEVEGGQAKEGLDHLREAVGILVVCEGWLKVSGMIEVRLWEDGDSSTMREENLGAEPVRKLL